MLLTVSDSTREFKKGSVYAPIILEWVYVKNPCIIHLENLLFVAWTNRTVDPTINGFYTRIDEEPDNLMSIDD